MIFTNQKNYFAIGKSYQRVFLLKNIKIVVMMKGGYNLEWMNKKKDDYPFYLQFSQFCANDFLQHLQHDPKCTAHG